MSPLVTACGFIRLRMLTADKSKKQGIRDYGCITTDRSYSPFVNDLLAKTDLSILPTARIFSRAAAANA